MINRRVADSAKFSRTQRGSSLIEYALVVVCVTLIASEGLTNIGYSVADITDIASCELDQAIKPKLVMPGGADGPAPGPVGGVCGTQTNRPGG